MLRELQSRLAAIVDVEVGAKVEDFLCDAESACALGGRDALRRKEVLFVVSDGDDTSIGLYLDAAVIARLRDAVAWDEDFDGMALVSEGVSHFHYVAFRAAHDEPTSELELELQAEIDKYALAVLGGMEVSMEGWGVRAIQARDQLHARSVAVRERLFDEAEYLDGAQSIRGERYREATRLARRWTGALEPVLARGDLATFVRELRRFYRCGMREKRERCEVR